MSNPASNVIEIPRAILMAALADGSGAIWHYAGGVWTQIAIADVPVPAPGAPPEMAFVAPADPVQAAQDTADLIDAERAKRAGQIQNGSLLRPLAPEPVYVSIALHFRDGPVMLYQVTPATRQQLLQDWRDSAADMNTYEYRDSIDGPTRMLCCDLDEVFLID